MRYRPLPPRLCHALSTLGIAALIGCSGGADGPTGPGIVSFQSADFRGQVVDQHTRQPVAGVRVSGGGSSTWTDEDGRFQLATSTGAELTLSGTGYYERVAVADGAPASFSLVPRSFDMTSFNDVARDHSSGTLRWVSSPAVYIDVRAHSFGAGQSVPPEWVEQVVSLTPGFLSRWTGGALASGSVTVGSMPPSPGTPGTLVISFDEDPARYPSAATAGAAIASWDREGVIRSATVRLRFSHLSGDAAAFSRQAVLGHEIGHALGLAHMDGTTSSMMAPVIRTPELSAFDRVAGALLYDRLPGTRADDRETAADARSALAPSGAFSAGMICAVEIQAGH